MFAEQNNNDTPKTGNGKGSTASPAIVPAVDEAARVLLQLARAEVPKMNLTEIARAVGIHKSKAYSILNTLSRYGFVVRDPEEKRYSLGPGLIPLSRRVLDDLDVRELVLPHLKALAQETRNAVLYGAISDGGVVVVAKEEGGGPLGVTIRVGQRFPLTWGAHGKAIVAAMAEEDRKTLLKGERLQFHGEPGRIDRKRLRAELAACRGAGFAADVGEMQAGVSAVAAPVAVAGGKIVGVLFLVGTFPAEDVERFGPLVAERAREVSRLFGASTDGAPVNERRS
jgi:DNA-binding IclR family transcriptional regulator